MKVQAKHGKVTQNMHGTSRNYRYVWDVSTAAATISRSGLPGDAAPTPCRKEESPPEAPPSPWTPPGCAVSSPPWTMVMSTHVSVLVDYVGPPSAEVCRTSAISLKWMT